MYKVQALKVKLEVDTKPPTRAVSTRVWLFCLHLGHHAKTRGLPPLGKGIRP
jgi:hypothetical protein